MAGETQIIEPRVFLHGTGEMHASIAKFDWAKTPLGPISSWPSPLKTLVLLMLASEQPMFMAWGPACTWLYNDAFIPILGNKHPKALGQPALDVVWAEAREVLAPMFNRVFAGESVHMSDFAIMLDRRGRLEEAHFSFSYTPARDENEQVSGLFGVCIETTEQVEANRRQENLRERQRRQFEQAPGFIIIMRGPHHVVEFVNNAHRQLFNSHDWIGRTIREAIPSIAGQGFFEHLDRVLVTGESYEARAAKVQYRRSPNADEETRFFNFIYAPWADESGKVVGVFCEGFDVTEAQIAQESLRNSEIELRKLNESLESRVLERTSELLSAQEALRQSQKLEAMGQLTGGVAHDFNNLLTPIVGALDLLQRRQVGSTRELRLIDGALQSAERAKNLVHRLLAFARRQPLQVKPVDIPRLVDGMRELLTRTIGPTIEVTVDVPRQLPAARADANQIELALLNLSVNARDAMPNGGSLRIAGEARTLGPGEVGSLPPGNYVLLSVSDTGVGMDEATRARAIEPFYSTKGVGRGTGLGLSMVHGFASQLGGTLEIRSRLGEGTQVELWLPATDLDDEDQPSATFQTEMIDADATALIIDDDEPARVILADMLFELGYQVTEVASAEEALNLIENGFSPQLIMTDHMMPGMTGAAFAAWITEHRPETHVVLVSGFASTDGIPPDIPLVNKPFRESELRHCISTLKARRSG